MKRHLFFILAFISIVFTACNLTGSADSTPDIVPLRTAVTQHKDSLYMSLTDTSRVYRLDTVHVGDTVTFIMGFTGNLNNLVSVRITNSVPDSVAQVLLSGTTNQLDSIFLPTSNYAKGVFYLRAKSVSLIFPFKYVAKKPTKAARLSFFVQSDANFKDGLGDNSNTLALRIPIVAKKDTVK